MKQLVEFLAGSLVEYKEEVRVSQAQSEGKMLLSLCVHPDDLGKVIGKKGRTVKAIRVLISAFASLQGQSVSLQVIEPEKNTDSSETQGTTAEMSSSVELSDCPVS